MKGRRDDKKGRDTDKKGRDDKRGREKTKTTELKQSDISSFFNVFDTKKKDEVKVKHTEPGTSSASRKNTVSPSKDHTKPGSSKSHHEKTPKKKQEVEETQPAKTSEEKKRVQGSIHPKFLSRGKPKSLGSKEIPTGTPDCLHGLTFVTTGVLDSFERDEIVSAVEKYGGRVTSSISRKTSYLLVGDEPGESKINKAIELKIPRMTEDEFLNLIRKSKPKGASAPTLRVSDDEDDPFETVPVVDKKKKSKRAAGKASPEKSKPSSSKRSRVETVEEEKEDESLSSTPVKRRKTESPRAPPKEIHGSKEKHEEPKPSSSKAFHEKTPKKGNEGKPIRTPEEKKRIQSSNYFKFISRGGPKHLGSKEVPVGAPDCLHGLTFVTTGVLDSFERDDIVSIVEKYGGRVTTGVSRKTSYLLVGDEPGESKTKKAAELSIPKMTEDEFLDMIRKSNPSNATRSESRFLGVSDEEGKEVEDSVVEEKQPERVRSSSLRESDAGPSKRKYSRIRMDKDEEVSPSKVAKREKADLNTTRQDTKRFASKCTSESAVSSQLNEQMWVDKYKPESLKSVVGQAGDKSNASKLIRWLQNWFNLHGKSGEKLKAAWPGLRDPDGKTFKAALLSGPPGIGKTTTAHLCCKEVGYDLIELNASDTRNKKGLHDSLSDSLTSKAVTGFNQTSKKHVLIMDEVDGMSGNEDRGGVQELISLIKSSKVPVICICNDRNHPKIRSLANYCFDLRFSKPTNVQLKGMIQSICFKEKMKLPTESAQQLIISTDHDIRQIIHQLQLIHASSTGGGSLYNPEKDLRFGPWDVCRKVFSAFEHRQMSIQDKSNLFFQDYNIGPLFVHENYLRWTPAAASRNPYKHMDLLKSSAESIATGDIVESILRRSNNWSLLPTQAIFSSILPGEYMEGDEVSGIQFPLWLGKNSSKGKNSRLLRQLHNHVHLQVSGSLEALNMDYLPYLRRAIVAPLVEGDAKSAATLMQDYCLLREDLDSVTELSLWPGSINPIDGVPTKTKAAFTRQVNKEILPYATDKFTKSRGKKVKVEEEDAFEELEEDEDTDAAELNINANTFY